MESTLSERPDHPINLCRSFYAQQSSHHFSKALRRRDGTLAVVAAMKRFQAPRPGETAVKIADLEDIAREARALSTSGVDAALVYTDSLRFGVETSELTKIARLQRVSNVDPGMPIARQDLIIDAVQIAEAAVAGATAVNIVAAAALPEIMELMNSATSMGIESIIECHTELERDFAMECGATMLYLTNWDRTRNKLVPGTAERLIEAVPPWVLTMGGGGLTTASDCWSLLDAGFNGVVLGTALLQTQRPRGFISEIRSQKRHSGNIFAGDMGVPFSENTE